MISSPKLTAAEKAVVSASVTRSNAVNTFIENLKTTDAAQFEKIRRLSFEEIATIAGL